MHVVIFEGQGWPSFAPLSLSRPVFMLRCGLSTLLERQIRALNPTRLTLWVRPKLADYCRRHIVPNLPVATKINEPLDYEPALLCSGNCVHLQSHKSHTIRAPGLSQEDCLGETPEWMKLWEPGQGPSQSGVAQYAWDLSYWNKEAIVADAGELRDQADEHPAGPYHLVHKENVHLAANVTIAPGVVLDASGGPVVIDSGANLGANSVIQGPCHIGAHTTLTPLTLIRPGTSIGSGCKIGGEVSASIIMGNTNKAHYGYLGDSYLGEWVNLGAGTTTSNLKNTYGPITMQIGPKTIPTERRFLGSIIGDQTKTAIGTRLMTGSYVGFCSMLAGSDLPPRFVPSFSFWTDKGTEKYRLDKAREVMTQVLDRRGRQWTEQDQFVLDYAAETAAEIEGV